MSYNLSFFPSPPPHPPGNDIDNRLYDEELMVTQALDTQSWNILSRHFITTSIMHTYFYKKINGSI